MSWMIYGANGFVGQEIAREAARQGLRPILAGRNHAAIAALASALGLEFRVFNLDGLQPADAPLDGISVVLHCAGPYIYTCRPMVEACLFHNAHYVDITGEIPVYELLHGYDQQAKDKGIMLLPGAGFDVVPTDCLALYLKERMPDAQQLALAFKTKGGAGIPPGTANTLLEMAQYKLKIRQDGRLIDAPHDTTGRMIDLGKGPVYAVPLSWGDVFTAYFSTGIPNIRNYTVLPASMARQLQLMALLRPLFRLSWVRRFFRRFIRTGSTPEQRARTRVTVWGEVQSADGRSLSARLEGPEAGVEWTKYCALSVVKRVLAGEFKPGFQTPARAYGVDLVLETPGVTLLPILRLNQEKL